MPSRVLAGIICWGAMAGQKLLQAIDDVLGCRAHGWLPMHAFFHQLDSLRRALLWHPAACNSGACVNHAVLMHFCRHVHSLTPSICWDACARHIPAKSRRRFRSTRKSEISGSLGGSSQAPTPIGDGRWTAHGNMQHGSFTMQVYKK